MTTKAILELSINAINAMSKEELADITKTLSETARKRISKLPKGPAYAKLKARAQGKYGTFQVEGLSYTDGKLKIRQNFKTMDLNQMRALRKELAIYLKDPTSKQKGYDAYYKARDEETNRRIRVKEATSNYDNIYDVLDEYETASELHAFAREQWAWDSDPIHNAVVEYQDKYGEDAPWEDKQGFFEFYKEKIEARLREDGKYRESEIPVGLDYGTESGNLII